LFFEPQSLKELEETQRDSLFYDTKFDLDFANALSAPSCALRLRGSKYSTNKKNRVVAVFIS